MPSAELVEGLPSGPRRFAAFVVWNVVGQLAVGILIGLVGFAVSANVSGSDGVYGIAEAAGYGASLLVLIVTANLGADGRLPGARRRVPKTKPAATAAR